MIASSAGFPDAEPRRSVKFAVFATAGTDDFNYLEMRRLDAALTSPHYLAVFEGGHALPPDSRCRPRPSSGWSSRPSAPAAAPTIAG